MAKSVANFINEVEVKLNRLDSSSYEDVRPEEIVFFANDALKALTLAFDIGAYSPLLDEFAIKTYLAYLYTVGDVGDPTPITDNEFTLPEEVFKFKDMEAYVTIGSEVDWVDTRFLDNDKNSSREDNPFRRSFPDSPIYRLIDEKIVFEVNGFNVTKARYEYLKYPVEITEGGTLDYPFITELEDKTVTIILENLENQRLGSQPQVSKT
jgi:hypothetical protein